MTALNITFTFTNISKLILILLLCVEEKNNAFDLLLSV